MGSPRTHFPIYSTTLVAWPRMVSSRPMARRTRAPVEGQWDRRGGIDGWPLTEVEGRDPGVLVQQELVAERTPGPQFVVDDPVLLGLIVDGIERPR